MSHPAGEPNDRALRLDFDFGRATWTAYRENVGLMHKSEQQLFRLGASVESQSVYGQLYLNRFMVSCT